MRAVCIIALLVASGFVQAQTGLSPASAPASGPAAADLAKGTIDPIDLAGERMRFLEAAGVTNELDANAFEANRGKKNPFVRSFDRWEEIIKFDRNHNGTIDWFEADAYRQDLRKKVLAIYGDKDGKLTGKQREAANLALAEGNLFKLLAGGSGTTRPAWVAVAHRDANAPAVGLWGASAPAVQRGRPNMAEICNLTDEQKAKVAEIEKDARKAWDAYDKDMAAASKDYQDAVKGGEKDAIAAARQALTKIQAAGTDLWKKVRADTMAVLAPEQRLAWIKATDLPSIQAGFAGAEMTEEQGQQVVAAVEAMVKNPDTDYGDLSEKLQALAGGLLTAQQKAAWLEKVIIAPMKEVYKSAELTPEQWDQVLETAVSEYSKAPSASPYLVFGQVRIKIGQIMTPEQREKRK